MESVPSPMKVGVVEIEDEEEVVTTHFARDISFSMMSLLWTDSDMPDDIATKATPYLAATDTGRHIELTLADGSYARVRALDPYDGVRRSRAGVPQPLEVLQAEIQRSGGVVAQELNAVVAADNSVVTLILETGIGTYVRFSGDWQQLSPDSTALEDTYLLEVSPEALTLFDGADMANTTLSAFDLPRMETLPSGEQVRLTPEPVGLESSNSLLSEGVLVAAGTSIPTVDTLDDLGVAIRYAKVNPGARWYVTKRARILGASSMIPSDWAPTVAAGSPTF